MLLGVSSTFSTFSTRLTPDRLPSLCVLRVLRVRYSLSLLCASVSLCLCVRVPPPLPVLPISTAKPARAAGDCRPYRWTAHGPPFYILYIFYTVNKLRRATKAPLTFRHMLRAPRPQPNGRGRSPLRPAATTRPRSGLSKNLFACVSERYPRSPRRSVSVALCCSSEFILHSLHFLHG